MKKIKVVLTGGHLTPCLAVLNQMAKEGYWQPVFIGRRQAVKGITSVEKQTIEKLNLPFYALSSGKLPPKLDIFTPFLILKIIWGFLNAFYLLSQIRPALVISFGGYLAPPVVWAAFLLGIPSLAHEQTLALGWGNRLCLPFVRQFAYSWPETASSIPSSKAIFTGNPIRQEFFAPPKLPQALKLNPKLPTVFITTGNIGSQIINRQVKTIFPKLLSTHNLVHQCGHAAGDYQELKKLTTQNSQSGVYQVFPYLSGPHQASIMNQSQFIIARAGANTVSEIALLGKPAILIPLPFSHHHEQLKNARALAKIGLVEIIIQDQLSPASLLRAIQKISRHLKKYQANAPAARQLIDPLASQKITQAAIALL